MADAEQLRGIWQEVLRCDDVGPDADFFELGGTSIQALDVAVLVHGRLGVEVDAVDVVLEPRFDAFVSLVSAKRRQGPSGVTGP